MTGREETPAPIHPALSTAERIERALNHVARSLELELADIALSRDSISDSTEQDLRNIGAALLRVSQIGITTANSLAEGLGEAPSQLVVPELPVQAKVLVEQQTTETIPVSASVKEAGPVVEEVVQPVAQVVGETPKATPEVVTTPEETRLPSPEQISEVQTTKERKKLKYEGDMYARIVTEKETPIMELREGMEAIPVRIISDDTIVVNGEKIVLQGDHLFIFNAAMKLRDQMMTAKDMRALGFRMDTASASMTFSKAMNELHYTLQSAMGSLNVGIIKKTGQAAGTRYAVNPAVQLVDERHESSLVDAPDSESETVKKK